jgi:hypothetical protein
VSLHYRRHTPRELSGKKAKSRQKTMTTFQLFSCSSLVSTSLAANIFLSITHLHHQRNEEISVIVQCDKYRVHLTTCESGNPATKKMSNDRAALKKASLKRGAEVDPSRILYLKTRTFNKVKLSVRPSELDFRSSVLLLKVSICCRILG